MESIKTSIQLAREKRQNSGGFDVTGKDHVLLQGGPGAEYEDTMDEPLYKLLTVEEIKKILDDAVKGFSLSKKDDSFENRFKTILEKGIPFLKKQEKLPPEYEDFDISSIRKKSDIEQEKKEAIKNVNEKLRTTGWFSLNGKDYIELKGLYFDADKRLGKNPELEQYEIMTDDEIAAKLKEAVDNMNTAESKESGFDDYYKNDILKTGILYLKEKGRLPAEYEDFDITNL